MSAPNTRRVLTRRTSFVCGGERRGEIGKGRRNGDREGKRRELTESQKEWTKLKNINRGCIKKPKNK